MMLLRALLCLGLVLASALPAAAAQRQLPRDNQGERRATIRMRMAPGVG